MRRSAPALAILLFLFVAPAAAPAAEPQPAAPAPAPAPAAPQARPASAPSRPGSPQTLAIVWEHRVRPEMAERYEAILRDSLIPALRKVGGTLNFTVHQTVVGQEESYTLLLWPMVMVSPDIASLEWLKVSLGEEEGARVIQAFRECLETSTSRIVRFRTDLGEPTAQAPAPPAAPSAPAAPPTPDPAPAASGETVPAAPAEGASPEAAAQAQALRARMGEMSRRRQALAARSLDLERSLQGADAATVEKLRPELEKVRGLLAEVSEALAQMEKNWKDLPEEARAACNPEVPAR